MLGFFECIPDREFHELVGKTTHADEKTNLHVAQEEHAYTSDERVESNPAQVQEEIVLQETPEIIPEENVQPQVVNLEEEQVIVNNDEVVEEGNTVQEEVVENEESLESQDPNLESQEEMDPQREAELEAYVKDFTHKPTLLEKVSEKLMFWKRT